MADVLDVLIVGGGAAGYPAGIFAARDRCRALLLEKFSPGFPQDVAGHLGCGELVLDLRFRLDCPRSGRAGRHPGEVLSDGTPRVSY